MKKTYDPMLRKTLIGKHLYYHWKMVRRNPHTPEWDFFPDFYTWAMSSGYAIGAKLHLIDATLPHSPDNCVWRFSRPEEKQPTRDSDGWTDKWNRTVNRIRKHYGMSPLEGTDYGDL